MFILICGMKLKRVTVVLVVIALLLAGTAVAVNIIGEDDVSTDALELQINDGGSQIGVTVLPNENAEDKMTETNP